MKDVQADPQAPQPVTFSARDGRVLAGLLVLGAIMNELEKPIATLELVGLGPAVRHGGLHQSARFSHSAAVPHGSTSRVT